MNRLDLDLDVIILSECWISKCPHMPSLPGFDLYQTDFNNKCEGVVVFVRSSLHCKVILPSFQDANCIVLTFSKSLAIVAVYRSPSEKVLNPFLNSLDTTLNSLKNYPTIALVGDININIIPDSLNGGAEEYLNLVASHAMLPAHVFPTRKKTCLDHS